MKTLTIYCAGAARAVVSRAAQRQRQAGGAMVNENYGAVGALKKELLAGGAADIVILTAEMIDELAANEWLAPDSRVDLGQVGSGFAVLKGEPAPPLGTVDELRAGLLAASRIICPDPAIATAGKMMLGVLEQLGIAEQVSGKMEFTQSGYAAMARLANSKRPGELGFMQLTEIAACDDVKLAAPLPPPLQQMTTYTAGIPKQSGNQEGARAFLHGLVADEAQLALRAAGFTIAG